MSKLKEIIFESHFEEVRAQIAAILSDEFAGQLLLNQTALAEEQAKPDPDPILIAKYESNIAAIPERIWEERFQRINPGECIEEPVVNVMFVNAPLDESISYSQSTGTNKYIIEVYAGALGNNEETPDKSIIYNGDALAAIKLQRCLAVVRAIFSFQGYSHLGLNRSNPFIGSVNVTNMLIGQPEFGVDGAESQIRGQIELNIKMNELNELETGELFDRNTTTVKLFDTNKGYYWIKNKEV